MNLVRNDKDIRYPANLLRDWPTSTARCSHFVVVFDASSKTHLRWTVAISMTQRSTSSRTMVSRFSLARISSRIRISCSSVKIVVFHSTSSKEKPSPFPRILSIGPTSSTFARRSMSCSNAWQILTSVELSKFLLPSSVVFLLSKRSVSSCSKTMISARSSVSRCPMFADWILSTNARRSTSPRNWPSIRIRSLSMKLGFVTESLILRIFLTEGISPATSSLLANFSW